MDLTMRDTIAACATPPGASGIAVVRMSGTLAEGILRSVFSPRTPTERFTHGRLYLGKLHDGETEIDECMAVIMRAPKSYTRQDVVEFQLHGSAYSVQACLSLLTAHGARPAEPGEFTLRAYLNGRIDLSQAETVMQLISADSLRAGQSAMRQLNGGVSRFVGEAQQALLGILAQTEAAIDYPEEMDEANDLPRLAQSCRELAARLQDASQERSARLVTNGLHIALIGAPNAGKSTLLNALLGEDKAIVTDIPGTTRDVLSGSLAVDGYRVTLYDTAGIHPTTDQIELLGIQRSYQAAAQADMIWWLRDLTSPAEDSLPDRLSGTGLPVVTIWTKADRADEALLQGKKGIILSARTGKGLDQLTELLKEQFAQLPETPLTNHRHTTAAAKAAGSILQAAKALSDGLSEEFAATYLHDALDTLASITGERADEALLDEIFSHFCVGK